MAHSVCFCFGGKLYTLFYFHGLWFLKVLGWAASKAGNDWASPDERSPGSGSKTAVRSIATALVTTKSMNQWERAIKKNENAPSLSCKMKRPRKRVS